MFVVYDRSCLGNLAEIDFKTFQKLYFELFEKGVGGDKELAFPRDTGYPLYKNEKKKVVVFEYHFDNPRLEAGYFSI